MPEAFDYATFLSHLTTQAGVYQMYDAAGLILYVGKAKNLKNRVSSYFQKTGHTVKTQVLV
ncbi:MAG TPA: GIY-YIG nuclease family protein, partial [Cellvibrionaceae bacterium]|nr:GIY-YIG nuclease family protein [Cellvibrionaceae bacterium]